MCLHGLIPLVQAVARDAELTRQLRNRFAARSHLTHRFELELRRELLTLDHGTPPGPLSPLSRSEEHTSELQSLMRISYAVFCLKKKKITKTIQLDKPYTITNTK